MKAKNIIVKLVWKSKLTPVNIHQKDLWERRQLVCGVSTTLLKTDILYSVRHFYTENISPNLKERGLFLFQFILEF